MTLSVCVCVCLQMNVWSCSEEMLNINLCASDVGLICCYKWCVNAYLLTAEGTGHRTLDILTGRR